ncbi:Reticulocyte-binding protein 2-like protein a [Colletotrichum aenigma]|uniref:Reticulocyte-binding protein 2-like protein a n=1 Tax=Colletotrichum aenigma TaxID=1215731 RepID=UPI0018724D3A|nr:Reticulocyte-binding protein 2-like protein a [Colletotrichum aenigma]KAF5502861.1 Reticulocyte-binding protein 2-like protein a [Colletotrichum aenigma]
MASSRAEGENGGSSPNTSSSIIGQNSSQSFQTGLASSETGPSTPRFPASVNIITSGQLVRIQRYLRHPGLDLPADVITYRNADLAIALGACDDNLDPKGPDVCVPEAQMPRHVSGHVEGVFPAAFSVLYNQEEMDQTMPLTWQQIRELVDIYVAARERYLGDPTETKGDHSQRRFVENVDKWIAMTKNRGAISDELTFPAKTRWAIASDPLHSRWKESTKRQLVEESREEDRKWKAQKETEVKERELEEKRLKLQREQREWKQKQKEFQEIKEQLQKSRRAQREWEDKVKQRIEREEKQQRIEKVREERARKEREQKEKQQKIEKARKEREQRDEERKEREQKAKLDKSERARKKREQKEKDREQMLQKERIKQEREHKEREQREIEQKEKRQKETEQNEREQNEREQEERARKQRELNEDIAKERTEREWEAREWKKRKRDSNGQAPGVAMRPETRSSNAPEDAEGVRRSHQPQIRPRNANREHRRR